MGDKGGEEERFQRACTTSLPPIAWDGELHSKQCAQEVRQGGGPREDEGQFCVSVPPSRDETRGTRVPTRAPRRSAPMRRLSEIKLSDLELLPAALDFLDLPGVAVRYGRVGSLALSIPGGALAWLVSKKEPISVTISDVHILVDKVVPVPGEAGLKALAAKTAALDLDAAVYRQQVADWIQDALSDSAASAAVRSGAPKSLVEAVLYKLHVRVERVHVRYEDRTSAAASPFAAGVTLDSLSLSTDEPAVIAGSDTPSRRHRAAMGCLAVYWDPLAPGGGYLEAGGDGRATYSAFDGGIARADAPPPPHCYVVEPLSTDLRAVRSSGGSATLATPSAGPPSPGAAESAPPPLPPALSATLAIPALRLCLSRMQMLQATFLGKWVADQSALRLRDELKGCVPRRSANA